MEYEKTKEIVIGQTLYLPVKVTGFLNNRNEIEIDVCYASRDGRVTSTISAYYEQLIIPPAKEAD